MAFLLRTPVAAIVALISALVAAIEILAINDLFTPALLLWALCIVCAIRASARRRRGPTIAYMLGALPGTVALTALIWVTS